MQTATSRSSTRHARRTPTVHHIASGWLCITLLCSLAHAGTANAQSDAPGRALQDREYRALIDQALSEFEMQNWPEARALFLRAHTHRPSARTLRGLGMVSYEMRDYVRAADYLDASLADQRKPLTEAQRNEAETWLRRSRSFLGRYELSLTPSDASLAIDGDAAEPDADGSLWLGLGLHTAVASAPGYVDATRELDVQGGERRTLRIDLARDVPGTGADPDGVVPASRGGADHGDARSSRGLRWSWVGLGTTAAFGAATAAVWFSGQAKLDERVEQCEAASSEEGCDVRTSDLELHETLTAVGLGLTGLAAAGTVVAVSLEWPRRGPERRVDVDVALQGTGLRVQGSF